jgi:hypothetical protein
LYFQKPPDKLRGRVYELNYLDAHRHIPPFIEIAGNSDNAGKLEHAKSKQPESSQQISPQSEETQGYRLRHLHWHKMIRVDLLLRNIVERLHNEIRTPDVRRRVVQFGSFSRQQQRCTPTRQGNLTLDEITIVKIGRGRIAIAIERTSEGPQ